MDRLVLGAELNEPDVATFYAPGPVGYIDYPTLRQTSEARDGSRLARASFASG